MHSNMELLYGLKGSVSRTTVWSWMKSLGMKFQAIKKTYFVDSHETKPNRIYRRGYLRRYFEKEKRQAVWIQIPVEELRMYQTLGKLPSNDNFGYCYTCQLTNVDMVELHVDCFGFLTEEQIRDRCSTQFGGNFSVRLEADQERLILFGHDECCFRQHAFSAKGWTMPDGTQVRFDFMYCIRRYFSFDVSSEK